MDYTTIYKEQIYYYKHFNIPPSIVDRYPEFAKFMKDLDDEFDNIHQIISELIYQYSPLLTTPKFLEYLSYEYNFPEIKDLTDSDEDKRILLSYLTDWYKRRATQWFFEYLIKEFGINAEVISGRDYILVLSDKGEISTESGKIPDIEKYNDGAIHLEIDNEFATKLIEYFDNNLPVGKVFWYTFIDKFKIIFKLFIYQNSNYDQITEYFGIEYILDNFFGSLSSTNQLSNNFYLDHSDELYQEYEYWLDINFEFR